LDRVKSLSINDAFVLAVVPFVAMAGFVDIDPVLHDMGKGAISEGNAAPVRKRPVSDRSSAR
jgi:hypothetical protein